MANEITDSGCFPVASINETLEFYVALGFEITYQQTRPNTYGCVKHEDIDLHFFTMKGYEPKDSYSTCLVLVPTLPGCIRRSAPGCAAITASCLSLAFRASASSTIPMQTSSFALTSLTPAATGYASFRQANSLPPRATTMRRKRKDRRNCRGSNRAADWLVEAKGDFEAAAQMLDKALAQDEPAPPAHRFQALVLRASLAISLDDQPLARTLLSQAPPDSADRRGTNCSCR